MWKQYLNRLFPIRIVRGQEVLVIDDRRPGDSLLLSVLFAAGALFISAVLLTSGFYWPVILSSLLIPVFAVRSLLLPFREKYIFNRGQAIYTFTRQGVLKRQTTEGDLSQIRAVQMERKTISTEHGTREIFRIALLLRQGLLLGASDTMILREDTPISSSYEREARIANAIADFLELPVPDIVNM